MRRLVRPLYLVWRVSSSSPIDQDAPSAHAGEKTPPTNVMLLGTVHLADRGRDTCRFHAPGHSLSAYDVYRSTQLPVDIYD